MTFPSVVAATAYQSDTSSASSWDVYSGVNVKKDSIFVVSCGGSRVFSTASSGWVKLGEQSGGNGLDSAVFYKTADAASDSLTITVTGGTTQFTGILLRTSGGEYVEGSSQFGTANPPNLSLTQTRDVLWVAIVCAESTDIASGAPSGYSGLTTSQALTGFAGSTSLAYRTAAGSSENPGAFSGIVVDDIAAWTIALYASRNRRSSGFL